MRTGQFSLRNLDVVRDVQNRTRDTKSLLDVDNAILDYALKMTAFSSTTKNYLSKLIT